MVDRARRRHDGATIRAVSCARARGPTGEIMGAQIVISGSPPEYGQALDHTAQALNERHRFRGTLIPRNDDWPRSDQDHRATGRTMGKPGQQLGVLRLGLKVLGRALHIEGVLRGLDGLLRLDTTGRARGPAQSGGLNGERHRGPAAR
ncbi:hypothetical protein WYO_3676 [Methylobacterium sp. GXF4]|nr:hypothetical protein WYO_3676 [Methylobacterium sp. GXF4]